MTGFDLGFVIIVLATLMLGTMYLARLFASWRSTDVVFTPEADPEIIALLDRKAHLLEDLRDLELDYQMGKVPEEVYTRDKKRLEPEAIQVIKALEQRGVTPLSGAEWMDEEDEEDDE